MIGKNPDKIVPNWKQIPQMGTGAGPPLSWLNPVSASRVTLKALM